MKNFTDIVKFSCVSLFAAATWLAAGEPRGMTILCTNDAHTHVDDAKIPYSSLAMMKSDIRQSGRDVLLLDAGDFSSGTVMGVYDKGHSVVEIMNAVGYDAIALGNHEFDFGVDILYANQETANFPFLSCGLFETNGVTHEVSRPVKEWTVITNNSFKVGLVGVTTPTTLGEARPSIFLDPSGEFNRYDFEGRLDASKFYESVQRCVDAAAKVSDFVVVIGHLGLEETVAPYRNVDLIEHTTNFCLLVDGHSHSKINGEIATNALDQVVKIIQTGTALETVGRVEISLPDSGPLQIETSLVSSYSATNETIRAMETNLIAKVDAMLGVKVAESPTTLHTYVDGIRLCRYRETDLGDFTSDAWLWYANDVLDLDCDIAVCNGGALRTDLKAGDVTLRDLLSVNPFGNTMCVVAVTGGVIRAALEFSSRNAGSGEDGGFLQVAGVRYSVATNEAYSASSSRVYDIEVYDRTFGEWASLNDTKTYRVAGANFLLEEGGNEQTMWKDGEVIVHDDRPDYLVLSDYAQAFGKDGGEYPVISTDTAPFGPAYMVNYENDLGGGRVRLVNTGPFDQSEWVSPDIVRGYDVDERCGTALLANGFSAAVSQKLANTKLYSDFIEWANNRQHRPNALSNKNGVILAAAYNASDVPAEEDVDLRIENFSVGDNFSFTVVIDGSRAGFDPAHCSRDLLMTSLDILGTESLADGFSKEGFSVSEVSVGDALSVSYTVNLENEVSSFFIKVNAE